MDCLGDAARALLGPGVAVAGGRVADWVGPLHRDEEEAVARAVPRRREEFAAGRTAIRAAMAALGHRVGPLPRHPDGPPLWPPGLTGTLSHGGGHVLAAVARQDDVAALGLDLEPYALIPHDLAIRICGADEDRSRALEVFGAKEVAYKAQFALSGQFLDFDALTIEFLDEGDFIARFRQVVAPFAPGDGLEGGQVRVGDLLLSAVRIDPSTHRAGSFRR